MRGRPLLYQVFPAQPSRRRECQSSSKFSPLLGTSYFASAAALASTNDGVISHLLCLLTEACICRCPARLSAILEQVGWRLGAALSIVAAREETEGMRIGFIGTGRIAEAVVTGLCTSAAPPDEVLLSPRNAAIAQRLAMRFPIVQIAANN